MNRKMKIALVCPASLPATQFGGILFLCVDIARESAKSGHDVTIYTTDLDFANNANTFNKNLPRLESQQGFKINRTHVWLSFRLFFVNPSMYLQLKKGSAGYHPHHRNQKFPVTCCCHGIKKIQNTFDHFRSGRTHNTSRHTKLRHHRKIFVQNTRAICEIHNKTSCKN
jgi:hypothetical protein